MWTILKILPVGILQVKDVKMVNKSVEALEAAADAAELAYKEARAAATAAKAEKGKIASDRIAAFLAEAELSLTEAAKVAREANVSFVFSPRGLRMQELCFTPGRDNEWDRGCSQEWYTSSDQC